MAKRKGSSTSSPRARKKSDKKKGSKAKISERGAAAADEKEFWQLRCEVYPLLGELDKLSEQQRKLKHKLKRELKQEELKVKQKKFNSLWLKHNSVKAGLSREARRLIEGKERWNQMERERRAKELKRKLKRKLDEQLRQLRREEGQLQRKLLPKSNRLKELCSSREAENTQRLLDKLPLDVWEKILDENDLFPLALSCRYFRQVQKDLVARTGQNGSESGKPGLTLRTTFIEFYEEKNFHRKIQPVSADYLRFCIKEDERRIVEDERRIVWYIKMLAAFQGHLPVLQELLADSSYLDDFFTHAAGGPSSSQSLHLLLVSASDLFLAFSSSQRAEAKWKH